MIGIAEHFIGTSSSMQEIHRLLSKLVENDLTITITGEFGVGKELIARTLHQLSRHRTFPFLHLNPTKITEDTAPFDEARGGTLFIDTVGDLPREAQNHLLRHLQQELPRHYDIRLICSTHVDLLPLVRAGQFREDLYYRLNVVPVRIPPLRERKEDIAPMAHYFLKKAEEKGLTPKILDAETIEAMQHYGWPGNVRELENMMYRLSSIAYDSIISKETFLNEIATANPSQIEVVQAATLEKDVESHLRQYFAAHRSDQLPPPGLYERILPLLERPLIIMTLRATGGNQVKTAYVLGINRNTLRKKMRTLGISMENLA